MKGRSGIAARDRLWLDARSVMVLDGLDVPSPQAIRAALRRWAAVSPDHPVFRVLTPDRTGWRRPGGGALDEHCDAMVVPLADDDVTDPDDLATSLYRRPPDIPLRFAAGRRFVAISLEHAMFDAWGAHRLFAAVLRAAVTGGIPEDFLDGSARAPLLTALARAGRQDPRRLARTLCGPRPSPPVAAAAEPAHPLAGAGTGEIVPWSPAPRTVSARSGPETLRALRAWRRGAPRGASIQTLLFAAARVALENAGLPPRVPGLYTLVDNRRYLDADIRVAGNFTIPIYLDPADPTDPAAIGASLTAQLDAGVPLVTTAAWLAHAARDRAGRHRDEETADGAPVDRERAAPVPVLNHLGRQRLFDPLPWRDGSADARYHALVTQGLPEDLTIYLTELRDRLNVCIGFHDNVFDTDSVRSVAEALARDPVGLVARQPVRQR